MALKKVKDNIISKDIKNSLAHQIGDVSILLALFENYVEFFGLSNVISFLYTLNK